MGQLEDMQMFIRVIDARGIGRAAEQLGIAKSAVSRRLSELEGRLGVKLLNRTTRTSSLTDAGRLYYQRSLGLLDDVAELNAQTSARENTLGGVLRVSAPVSFGLSHLSPAIAEFMHLHPALDINIQFTDHHIDLVEAGVDVAFRISELGDSTLRARPICPINIGLCASPDYIARKGEPKTPEDLVLHDLLHYDGVGSHTWSFVAEKGGIDAVPIEAKFVSNNGDFLRDMAVAGMGIIRTPDFISWQALKSGQLVKLMGDYSLPELKAYAVYPETRYLPRRVRAFIDFLVERFGDKPYWGI